MNRTAQAIGACPAPEQGQLVQVRNRLFLVQDVFPHETSSGEVITRLVLECLDDDRLGENLSVLWQREVNTEIHHADAIPVLSGKWDHPDVFDAFLTAVRWSSSSVLRGSALQSAFRGAIELEPYQLEPASRAVLMPRVNLLIADDTGLGKTIEAGLVIQELLARSRIRNCMVVCPASLQSQWKEEMEEKFDLEFRVIDRDAVLKLRREYGAHVNPWRSYPRLITSIDYLKRDAILSQWELTLDSGRDAAATWDLLILDEAHNCAPAGRSKYIRDSDRTRALRRIAPHFQHRLFLTATPHNGFTESFTALLSELDPLRFHRSNKVDPSQVQAIMVRRLKKQLTDAGEVRRPFAERKVVALRVPDLPAERQASDLLDDYIRLRMERVRTNRERTALQFALNLLKKRFLSSPLAFDRSLDTHIEHVTRPGSGLGLAPDPALVERLIQTSKEDVEDDVLRDAREQEALQESSRIFEPPTPEEDRLLATLSGLAKKQAGAPDAKLRVLHEWIEKHLFTDGALNRERLILFTEYRDSLEYLWNYLGDWLGKDRILFLMGGNAAIGDQKLPDREATKAAFQAPTDEHPVRILLATDAAAEGLNLQNHCRYLIHYEIPWNPNRLEQRNGRIDRHGQTAPQVFVHHFVYDNRRDSQFLETVVQKVEQMREDLGAVAALLEENVERFMLGQRDINVAALKPRKTLREDVSREIFDKQRLRQLRQLAEDARREGNIYPETLRRVLDAALRLEGHAGLETAEGDLAPHGALLRRPPEAWGERCARSVLDAKGRLLTLVFDPEHAHDRRDATLVHLDHPLMKRSLASFRRHMFNLGLGKDENLRRVTYRVAPAGVIPGPFLVAQVRLLAAGTLGQKLHEELRPLVWRIAGGNLLPASTDVLGLLPPGGDHPPISPLLGTRITQIVQRETPRLQQAFRELAAAEQNRVQAELSRRAEQDASEVVQMIKTRQQEIRERIKEIRKEMRIAEHEQLPLDLGPGWDPLEAEQLRQDMTLLERRLDTLAIDLKEEPVRIRERYRSRSLNAFPLGLEVILPEAAVRKGSLE